MVKTFPQFSKLDISNKDEILAHDRKFEPYSDFNFVSIFSWNVDRMAEVAMLNGNLVVSLPDYITGKRVYSILGNKQVDESLKMLLPAVSKLSFVPEVTAEAIENKELFNINLDRDNFDYVYMVEGHASLAGKQFLAKRKKYNRFVNRFGERVQIRDLDLKQPIVRMQIMAVVGRWIESKKKADSESAQERMAINRLLDHSNLFNLIGLAIELDGQMVGFSIYEILGDGYSISHFHKTDPKIPNSDIYLTCQAAKMLLKNSCIRVNWEQDLGLEGLRKSKLSYKPEGFLKKYKISLAT